MFADAGYAEHLVFVLFQTIMNHGLQLCSSSSRMANVSPAEDFFFPCSMQFGWNDLIVLCIIRDVGNSGFR